VQALVSIITKSYRVYQWRSSSELIDDEFPHASAQTNQH
jgi:hypothetical protein